MSVKKKAVITGASSGIGRALSHQLIDQYELFLCGRSTKTLQETAKDFDKEKHQWHFIELDLGNGQSVLSAADLILTKATQIDLLINNAGMSQRSLAGETEEKVEKVLFQVNYFGPVAFTKRLLPALRKSGKGRIAITSSIVGKFGFPLRSSYSAAKHALHGYFESLGLEEKENGVQVQLFVVGRAKTNVSLNAVTASGEHYGKMDKGQAGGISAKSCAQQMIKAFDGQKKEVLIGGKEKWMVHFKKFFPLLFYHIAEKKKHRV